jgi:hypothetical protein
MMSSLEDSASPVSGRPARRRTTEPMRRPARYPAGSQRSPRAAFPRGSTMLAPIARGSRAGHRPGPRPQQGSGGIVPTSRAAGRPRPGWKARVPPPRVELGLGLLGPLVDLGATGGRSRPTPSSRATPRSASAKSSHQWSASHGPSSSDPKRKTNTPPPSSGSSIMIRRYLASGSVTIAHLRMPDLGRSGDILRAVPRASLRGGARALPTR